MMIVIANITKFQVLRSLALKNKVFPFFHICLCRPISAVPEVTTETLASADDSFHSFVKIFSFLLILFYIS